MRDGCYVPGCKGKITPSRDIRSTVARNGMCDTCGARYRQFGSGDWKFDTERVECSRDQCDGYVEFELIPGVSGEAACWKCET
ncbi:MAG: hypothetical protein ACRDKJ_09635, partial [Actinomycetota bacterium]